MKNQRTIYIEKLSPQIVEWDVQIDRLKDQAAIATAETKSEYSRTVAALQLQRDQAAEKLQGIAMGTDDVWDDIKIGAEEIWGEVKEIFKAAVKKTD